MALTASQLKQRLAELLEVPKKEADNILWAFQTLCEETVKNADSLTIPGVGKLDCKIQAERMARNPRTGEKVKVPAKVAVKFRVANSLKDNAPSLKSKKGKALLEEVEKANKAKAKKRRQRQAEAEAAPAKKSNKKSAAKKSVKTKKSTKSTTAKKVKVGSGRKARY